MDGDDDEPGYFPWSLGGQRWEIHRRCLRELKKNHVALVWCGVRNWLSSTAGAVAVAFAGVGGRSPLGRVSSGGAA